MEQTPTPLTKASSRHNRAQSDETTACANGRSEFCKSLFIKHYGRNRLYDGAAGRYVTISNLRAWQVNGTRFVVIDAETGQDITRIMLA